MKIQNLTTQVQYGENEESRVDELELMELAKAAAHRAYAPYSRFRVGAAVKMADGTLFSGSNQENAAYPSGLCAERVTLFYANAQKPNVAVDTLLIYAETDEGALEQPITPCGACRQVILEKEHLQGSPITIILCGRDKMYRIRGIDNLMPLTFVGDVLPTTL
ncbi:MAG: cytidine deaminase [Bacteroidales bacterium]|nr:cytidine deaminase [Bacteroidales bacterium]